MAEGGLPSTATLNPTGLVGFFSCLTFLVVLLALYFGTVPQNLR